MSCRVVRVALLMLILWVPVAEAQQVAATVSGRVTDETGGVLPGVEVRLRVLPADERVVTTDGAGRFSLPDVPAGPVQLTFSMSDFATLHRDLVVGRAPVQVDVMLQYVLHTDVTVAGTRPADRRSDEPSLIGIAQSASQGAVTAAQVQARPVARAAEILETVPGLIASQHSGEGKANQYYLRGFNLDHGTDFATSVAGVPVNMPTHAHGQGYTDLNFVIPELVSGVQYSKGPYFAEQGDFATAGAASIAYVTGLERPRVQAEGGAGAFGRLLAAGSTGRPTSQTLLALDAQHDDGPWTVAEGLRRLSAVARYTGRTPFSQVSLTAMGYDARWRATDQIPRRAVAAGLLGRFDAVDATDGGSTSRYSGSIEWTRQRGQTTTTLSAFGLRYRLALFSNFTYFLDDPVNGDQFEQADRRTIVGGRVLHRRVGQWHDRRTVFTTGAQTRTDAADLALNRTRQRAVLATVRTDAVLETSAGAFADTSVAWTPWLRSSAGIRADLYRFRVRAISQPLNSGLEYAAVGSPKGGVVVGPFHGTELYLNAGSGFHSNDARGTTMTVDPQTGEAAAPVTPLVRAVGGEIGLRTLALPNLQATVSLWTLGLASELVFVGDAGTTDAGRPSRRDGVELSANYRPVQWLTLDSDLAWSSARFTAGPGATAVPGAARVVVAAGAAVDGRIFGSARLRYFGSRPLVEDGSQRSSATGVLNARLGYRWSRRLRLSLDIYNLLDGRASDIDYFYVSRLSGEPAAGVADIHFHPVLPRTLRASLTIGLPGSD